MTRTILAGGIKGHGSTSYGHPSFSACPFPPRAGLPVGVPSPSQWFPFFFFPSSCLSTSGAPALGQLPRRIPAP